MRVTRHGLVAFVAVCLLAVPSAAESAIIGPGTFDFSGTFTTYNDAPSFELQLDSPMLLEASTSSWASGGFDPVLTLLDAAGNFLGDNDDADPSGIFDSLLVINLGIGKYTLFLTQSPNFFEPSFGRFGFANTPCDDPLAFGSCDVPFGEATGSYALRISLTADEVPIPEPGTLALTGLGLLALARRRRRTPPSG